jgi:type II secretory pathway pseudopilin PulG
LSGILLYFFNLVVLFASNFLAGGGGGAKPLPGFTLAEALITLGIIGIIAALTMPALIADYQKYRETSGCSGSSQNNINNLNTAYVLADGSIMITYGANGYGLFLFDTNGFKGPNKAGHDLFAIDIRQNSGGGIQFFGNSEHSLGSDLILVCLPNAEIGVHDALFKTLGDIFN